MNDNKKEFRYYLAVAFLVFLLAWFSLGAALIVWIGISEIAILGYGTASGVFLKCFSDMWQFFYRKKNAD